MHQQSNDNEPEEESHDTEPIIPGREGDNATVITRRFQVSFEGESSSDSEQEVGEECKQRSHFNDMIDADRQWELQRTNIMNHSSDEEHSDDDFDPNQYQQLVEDEFGDFVTSEEPGTAEYSDDPFAAVDAFPDHQPSMEASTFLAPSGKFSAESKTIEATDGSAIETEEVVEQQTSVPAVRIGIPPLTQDKINTIREAMSRITIRNPNSTAVSIADTLSKSKLRIGDEITD